MNRIKQVHAHALRSGLDPVLLLLDALLCLPDLAYAHAVVLHSPSPPSTPVFNKLLRSHCSSPSHHGLSLQLYSHMLRHGHQLDVRSFTSLLSSCASCPRAPSFHAHIFKLGLPIDAHLASSLIRMYGANGLLEYARKVFDAFPRRDAAVWNSMISGYSRSGKMQEARELFEAMPARNVISWTSMVSGYAQNGAHAEAVEVFLRMWGDVGVKPNAVTLASVLPACASVGALEIGRRIEAYARAYGFARNPYVGNAMVEMYVKCGSVGDARRVFGDMGERRDLCSWNSMIAGLAVHGMWEEALDLFREMRREGFSPDDITVVGVLMACTHGGLVDQGRAFFESLEMQFSIKPKLEHYGCMVDLLGRSGHLHEAYNLINSMPMAPDSIVWGALLGACSFHKEVELAEIAAGFLFQLEPSNPGNYVMMANIYASRGCWDGVARLWKMKKWKQCRKAAGYSSIELGGAVQMFLVEDRSHPKSDKIYELLDEIHVRMMLPQHVLDLDDLLPHFC